MFFSLLLCSLFPAKSEAIEGSIKVISPNGGETYKVGDTVTIKWDATENIDNMFIGYSFGLGSLNWIATGIPNTGSYSWKVNIGNTSNTQIKIDVSGYDTGVGSLSDQSDGFFTVQQESKATPTPTSTFTPIPATPLVNAINTPIPLATRSSQQIQELTLITISQIEINEYYYFEGSKSTDLSQVEPANVIDFTLDRMDLMYFVFLGDVDLSSQEAVNTFENLDEMVYMDYYYIYFEWEFWVLFETEVECTFYDVANSLSTDAPVTLNGQVLDESEYKIEQLSNGEKKVAIAPEVVKKHVREGDKIEIALQPTMELNVAPGVNIVLNDPQFEIEGRVTDNLSRVDIEFNGLKSEIDVKDDGSFSKILDLDEGRNTLTVSAFKPGEEKSYSSIEGILKYEPDSSAFPNLSLIVFVCVGIGFVVSAGAIGMWFLTRKRK